MSSTPKPLNWNLQGLRELPPLTVELPVRVARCNLELSAFISPGGPHLGHAKSDLFRSL